MRYLVLLALFTMGCGEVGVEQRGESETIVRIELEYIKEIKQLCYDSLSLENLTEDQRTQAVAQCTLENIDLFAIDIADLEVFNNDYCQSDSDLSGIPVEDQQAIQDVCNYLGNL